MQYDIRRLDIYRKVPKDLTEPTYTGACISIISCLFIAFLFISELSSFLSSEVVSEMYVAAPGKLEERIPVQIDVSIPNLQCQSPMDVCTFNIGLDIQDDMGRHEVGFVENVKRNPINEGQGCRFVARFKVNKVPGNFHISTHSSRDQPGQVDMSHIVHEVYFGDILHQSINLPVSFNTLSGAAQTDANSAFQTFDYFLKVVPTVIEGVGGDHTLNPYQYTYAFRKYGAQSHGHMAVPAIWFRYDLSPITVKYVEKHKPFYSFLTTVCAIVGGTFTVAGIIDSVIFTATGIFKKAQLGKLN